MTVSTLRPNATTSNGGALTGGASAHAVLADDTDSSYVTLDSGESFIVGLGDLTLPAGAVIKSVTVRARTAYAVAPGQATVTVTAIVSDTASIGWAVATTTVLASISATGITDGEVDAATITLLAGGPISADTVVYELYLDITYVEQPVVSADAPTGTVADTNLPTVEWSTTLDADGGAQTRYEVKVYTDAQYGAGGFDPDTSTPTASSGITTGADLSWVVDEILADDTYRAYVRVAQTVNGELHWSDWDFTQFIVALDLPAVPTFTATVDNPNARIVLALEDNAGDATTDYFEVQRSLDAGTTWETVRQLEAGPLTPVGGEFTLYDYEAPQGLEVDYRARALHDYTTALAASAWVQDDATWGDGRWWIKHPHRPDLNVPVITRSYRSRARAGRQGVFQPLGAEWPIVVSDLRASTVGMIAFRLDDLDDQAALDELLDESATLLIQGPANADPPGYVRVTGQTREKLVDWQDARRVFDQLEYVQVDSPPGDVVAWP